MNFEQKYRVESVDKEVTFEWLVKKHYLKRIPIILHSFALFEGQIIVGVCTYGLPPQENCLLLCGNKYKANVMELNRLIKNDGLEKNLQTWFVAQTFKILKKIYPLIILSYADPNNGHNGYTYQALNFMFTGEGGSGAEYVFNNIQQTARGINETWFKNKGLAYNKDLSKDENFKAVGGIILPQGNKNRYVLFLGTSKQKKDMLRRLIWELAQYPKVENRNYDTSYKTLTQTQLF